MIVDIVFYGGPADGARRYAPAPDETGIPVDMAVYKWRGHDPQNYMYQRGEAIAAPGQPVVWRYDYKGEVESIDPSAR